ncbi:MAG: alpha/beta hydrolase [Alphaproteobacteria bacterium]|nr:alpha/beta hydrolase [Alphaproteobacteria bacterium]
MKWIRKILNAVAISLVIYFAIAFGLVYSQSPTQLTGEGGLDFSAVAGVDTREPASLEPYATRNGRVLTARHYPSGRKDAPMLVLVHGSGWHGLQFDALARKLSARADVIVPDLRGHGANPARRGDVDYIGQLEDDLADLIKEYRRKGQYIILAGHSSGGGLVVRFSGGKNRYLIDGAVLLAPFLKYNAPTTRENSGGWAQPMVRRIIGLSMLNNFNITGWNDLPVIQFNFPNSVLFGPLGATATIYYSYRMNTSFAPRPDYLKDVAALPKFLLIAGTEDEAFFAERYEPVMSEATDKGQYRLVTGVSHLGIVDAPATAKAMLDFIDAIAD